MHAPEPTGFPVGALLVAMFVPFLICTLFGLWGISRAKQHGVPPLYGFLAGFFLTWLGILIVPMLKTNRVGNRYQTALPNIAPPQQYGHIPQTYSAWQPPPPVDASPRQDTESMQVYPAAQTPAGFAPPQPTPDADGYIQCAVCGARVKAGRRSCMSCGSAVA